MRKVNFIHRKALLTAAGLGALLASCTVGPKYTKPTVPAAPAYSEQPPPSFKEVNGWTPANPSDSQIRGKWWELFGDPQLNALEEQVEPANQTLKASEASFRQARALIAINRSQLYPTVGVGPSIATNRTSANIPTANRGFQYGLFSLPIDVS